MASGLLQSFFNRFAAAPVDWDELEETLIRADLGTAMSSKILEAMRARGGSVNGETARTVLKEELLKTLPPASPPPMPLPDAPTTILMIGVNGTGKTTSSAKLAHRLKKNGHTCLLVAADTFRAAAIEQLCAWGERLGIEVARSQYQGDSAALCHDAWNTAKRRRIGFLVCDTAGRLHTKGNLMQELAKVARTLGKLDPDAPHEKWIVLDATTGSNALVQAREFHNMVPLTGVVLTKLDGSGKGGVAIAIQHELGIPVRYIGTGEGAEDFEAFDREKFVDRLLS
jgi:fused signal recognition particle receptor